MLLRWAPGRSAGTTTMNLITVDLKLRSGVRQPTGVTVNSLSELLENLLANIGPLQIEARGNCMRVYLCMPRIPRRCLGAYVHCPTSCFWLNLILLSVESDPKTLRYRYMYTCASSSISISSAYCPCFHLPAVANQHQQQ